ncbi:hypothetical protein ISCGN_019455 [Ixodes scapularis]
MECASSGNFHLAKMCGWPTHSALLKCLAERNAHALMSSKLRGVYCREIGDTWFLSGANLRSLFPACQLRFCLFLRPMEPMASNPKILNNEAWLQLPLRSLLPRKLPQSQGQVRELMQVRHQRMCGSTLLDARDLAVE